LRNRILGWVLICVIAAGGLFLRCRELDFPSIGYHNMKENEYLSMAQAMLDERSLAVRKIYFYNAFGEGTGIGVNKALPLVMFQLPMVSYHILFSWKVFGENLWGPRLLQAGFGAGAILLMYWFSLLVTGRVRLALFSGAVLAVAPLAVFFSRNLQPESPAFFFMVAAMIAWASYSRNLARTALCAAAAATVLTGLYKMSFLFGVLPMAACLPWRRILAEKKRVWDLCLWYAFPVLAAAAAAALLARTQQWQFNEAARVNLLEVFTPRYLSQYGRQLWWYAKDENFTVVFFGLAMCGVAGALIRRKGLLDRFLIGSVVSLVAYAAVFSDFINQHNYYQMPFLPLVCLGACAWVRDFAGVLRRKFSVDLSAVLILVSLAAALPLAKLSLDRMFGTVFLGTDVAGSSLKEYTQPQERIFLNTYAQGYAIARYARRPVGWPDTFAEFKEKEARFNIRYLCFYPSEFALALKSRDPEWFEYIRQNYHVREVGLTEEPRKVYYVILEKGKGSED
jgi:4-amino-4-deoxy-L-arabinose transferase-like glycosyltransferase